MKYHKMKIEEIEEKIEYYRDGSRVYLKNMYEALEEVRQQQRFRENPLYKKSTFSAYLMDRFSIRENTYLENVKVFTKYPDDAIKYGVGLVAKIERQCGTRKTKIVLEKIKTTQDGRKTALKRHEIDAIIKANSVYKPGIKKNINDWKAMYEAEKIAHNQTREALKEAEKIISEQESRINKLKNALLEEVA